MQSATTFLTLAAGLFLSIACATLLEELVFGGLFRLFFAPRLESQRQNQQNSGAFVPEPFVNRRLK